MTLLAGCTRKVLLEPFLLGLLAGQKWAVNQVFHQLFATAVAASAADDWSAMR